MLVLACSKKYPARCLAGISLFTGEWIRPVSSRSGGALSKFHAGVEGRYPRLREVVSFETDGPCPKVGQPENVLIADRPWVLERRMSRSEAANIVDPHLLPGPEILDGRGRALTVDEVEAHPNDPSLAVVEPVELAFESEPVPWGKGSREWARFRLAGWYHGLTLTDFTVRTPLLERPFGTYDLADLGIVAPPRTILTVSLGEPFDGRHYKLAAAVFGLE
jgi:hypothetical protein